MFNIRKKNFRQIDTYTIITLIALLLYGLVILYSATYSLERNFMPSQIIATIVGIVAVGIILILDIDFIKNMYLVIYGICIAFLVIVLIFGVGDEQWGARSWLVLGPISFQPSELVKIGLILSLGRFIELNESNINKPKVLGKVLLFAFFPVLLILRQPDAGTAMVFTFFIMVMLFTAGVSFKYFIGAITLGISSLPFLYLRLDEFQKNRILNFFHPERDVSSTGFQAMQGKIAIGSGKFFGQGLFKGIQSQNNFIPEKQTDYIFSVLSEELGFIGGICLIVLYGFLLYRLIIISRKSDNLYSKVIVMGFAAMFLFHIYENIGMTIGVMPITGIPLPFISYGGTFQFINLICIGFVLSTSIQKQPLSFK